MLRLLSAVLVLAFVASSSGEEFRWKYEESFQGKAPGAAWPESGVRGSNLHRIGEASFPAAYRGTDKFLITEDGDVAIRALLPDGDGETFKLWRWGFEPWGGAASESDLIVELEIRFPKAYEFPDELHLVELFTDHLKNALQHEYDGPKLFVSLVGAKKLRVHAFITDSERSTGQKINIEKIGALPIELKPDTWHSFRIHARLSTAPKPKNPRMVLESELPNDGSVSVVIDGKEAREVTIADAALRANERAWTSIVVGGAVNRGEGQKKACEAHLRRIVIGSPKE